jgi:mannose/fructose-specific phosphotransferase system component IIA
MLDTAESVLGRQEGVLSVGLPAHLGKEDLVLSLRDSLVSLDRGQGVLILVDFLGGTPCNAAAQFLGPGREVLTGLSLPVLVEALLNRGTLPLAELVDHVQSRGRESLVRLGGTLKREGGNAGTGQAG